MKINDIDICLRNGHHGWTDCDLWIDQRRHEFVLTHIFGCPLYEIAESATLALDGATDISFTWYEEPGQIDWKLTRDEKAHHIFDVEVRCYVDIKDHTPDARLDQVLSFRITRALWIRLVRAQLIKIADLAQDKHYQKDRTTDLPWSQIERLRDF